MDGDQIAKPDKIQTAQRYRQILEQKVGETRLAPVIKTPPDFAPIPSFPVRVDQYESGITHPCP